MIWFNKDAITPSMIIAHHLKKLSEVSLASEGTSGFTGTSDLLRQQRRVAQIAEPIFSSDGPFMRALSSASGESHVMEFLTLRAIESVFAQMSQSILQLVQSISVSTSQVSDIRFEQVCQIN